MSISDAGEAMARRRRVFVLSYCFPFTYSAALVCYKERTSFFVLKFAQSCRRRFTESSGVSLLTSDADPFSVSHRRSLSPPLSSSTGSSSDPSELTSNKESMELVDNDHESSQIRRVCSPTSTFLLLLFGSEPFTEYIQRFSPPLVCFSGSLSVVASLPVSASSSSRRLLHSHSSDVTLGFQLVDQLWTLQIMGQVLVLHLMGLFLVLLLMGLRDLKRLPVSPCFTVFSSHVACRFRHSSPIAILVVFNCCASHSPVPEEFDPDIATDWCDGPVSLLFHFRIKTQGNLDAATLPTLHWSSFAERLLHCGSPKLPRYQISSCRGQREIDSPPRYQISSCRGQREIVSPPRYQISSCRGQREIISPPRYQISSCRGQRETNYFHHLRDPSLLPSLSSSRRAVVAGDSAQLSLLYSKSFMERSLSLFSPFMERTLSLPSSFMERTLALLSSSMERTIPLNFSFMESVAKSSASMASRAQSTVRLPSLAEELLKTIFNSIKSEAFSMESTRDFIILPIYPYVYAYASLIHYFVSENFRASNSLAKSLLMTCIVTPG